MSKLIKCPTCGEQVSSAAAACPHCGETIRKYKPRSIVGGFVSLGLGLLLCVGFFVIGDHADSVELGRVGLLMLIFGVVGACICFTSPAK